ncbi:sulfate adenylyltransferase [Campylobacter blaseri]|uniref:Sulfate adenylyltransferase n=1 Tax=Campylobacter blaseri TaxID=2042961 RepID=A0A2P8QZ15_9BACT|nr:sulfate adenylyltransferase [Campylobacter blaseri]PSM51488.1 sulfate adenylyltransferase [Campylobacter blaseri]PSM52937.1 sulfate adenylyltransferase [Campylobacter blaseri]QKF86504.1 sulfate adenylyltransferase [Campylobacter blaseri]
MASAKKNRQIHINQEAYSTLMLIQNQIFSKFNSLMNEKEIDEVMKTEHLNDEFMPYAFIFAPGGKRNQEVIQSAKKDEIIDLIRDNKIVGTIKVKTNFKYKNSWKTRSVFGANSISTSIGNHLQGKYCLSGEINIFNTKIKEIKDKIYGLKKELNLKKVTALMLSANPFHRVHERLIRMTIDKADMIIIFLIRSSKENSLNFELRLKTLKYFVNNFLPRKKAIIIPLKNTPLFTGHKSPILECISAYKFGANKFVIGQNHSAIGMFFNKNQAHSITDKIGKNFDLEILVMPEYVYCHECKTIVSTKTCPHGQHRHMKYHSSTLRELLYSGILPPPILMRKEISAIILSDLFPNRFKNLQKIYDELFSNQGILETHTYEDFYKELAILYQTSSLT